MTNQKILNDIRVLDFTWVLAGPYATRLLADFGAEVIKVQPLLSSETDDAFSRGYYNTWNRNKLGITLNLERPEGIELAKKLIKKCDAVVENFTPRVTANWGLDYRNLEKIKPDIIMVSLSLMGHTDFRRDYTGFGPTVHAFSGMTYLTSLPGQPPTGPGFSYADHVSALYASLGLLGALEHRRKTGEGQHVDISEVVAIKSLLGNAAGKPEPSGNNSEEAAPHDIYPCQGKERCCAMAVFTGEEWGGLKRALGNPDWALDKRYSTLAGRMKNRDELDSRITAWTKEHAVEEITAKLQENGVPAGTVQDAADIAGDPQLKSRKFFIDRPDIGRMVDASPIKLSEPQAEYNLPAPEPGRDNAYVYGKLLGLSKKEMASLKERGII